MKRTCVAGESRAQNVIGQPLAIDGTPAEIIGVLPSSFKVLRSDPALLLPMQLDRATAFRGVEFDFQAMARLKPGVTLAQANADVARMIQLLPRVGYEKLQLQPNVRPLADDVIGDVARVLWILLAAVSQRTREIGHPHGARRTARRCAQDFLRHGLWLTATGLALGIGVALIVTRVMSALLFGVGPTDPMTYAAVSCALGAVALLATYLPARRASQVDPILALRADV